MDMIRVTHRKDGCAMGLKVKFISRADTTGYMGESLHLSVGREVLQGTKAGPMKAMKRLNSMGTGTRFLFFL